MSSSLARFKARPGNHRLRFTSRFVETPLPRITALELVYLGGESPAPEPEPKVVNPRPNLAPDWPKAITRKIHGDFHTGGFVKGVGKDFDPERYVATLADNHVNAICIFAKCHHGYAYYDTNIGTRHPGLDFDLMKAQIDACRKRGIHVWVYFSIAVDELYGSTQARPGEVQKGPFLGVQAGVETPYVKDYTWPMIVECVRDYDIDGFFFDFPGNEEFVQRTIQLIKGIKPGVVIAYNHQWDKPRDQLAKLDILEIESWMHKQTLYHWQYVARYARGAVPLTAMTTRFWTGWGDFGGLADEAMLRYEVASGLANGCAITIGDQLHPYGALEDAAYKRIGTVLETAKKIEPYVIDSEFVPYVALLKQKETDCHALVDAGLHFTIVDAKQDLASYKAVVVPDGSKIEEVYLGKLQRYVEGGGRLFVGGQLTEGMAKLCGVKVMGTAEPSYIRVVREKLPSPPATDLFTYLGVSTVDAVEGTTVLAPLVWTISHGTNHRCSHRQSPPADKVSGHAALTHRHVGKGQVVYTAVPLFDVYASWGYTALRQVFLDAMQKMLPPTERLAEVHSSASLEVSLNRRGNQIIIHLVHCPQSRRVNSSNKEGDYVRRDPIIDGTPTIANAELRLAESFVKNRKISSLLCGTELKPTSREDGVVVVKLPNFQIHAVLLLE
jgi:hypothetical protein